MRFMLTQIFASFAAMIMISCSAKDREWDNPNDPLTATDREKKAAAPNDKPPEIDKPVALSFSKFDLPIVSQDFEILQKGGENRVVILSSAAEGAVTFLSIERSKNLASYFWRLNARKFRVSEAGFSAVDGFYSPVNLFPECDDPQTGYGVSEFKITGIFDKYATPALDEKSLPDNLTHVRISVDCRSAALGSGTVTKMKTIGLSNMIEENISGLYTVGSQQNISCIWPSKKLILQNDGRTFDYLGMEKNKIPGNFSYTGSLSLGPISMCFEVAEKLHIRASSSSTCYDYNPEANTLLSVSCRDGSSISSVQPFQSTLRYFSVTSYSFSSEKKEIPIYEVKSGSVTHALVASKGEYGKPPILKLLRNGEAQELGSNFGNIASVVGTDTIKVIVGKEQPFGNRMIGWSSDRSTVFLSSPMISNADITGTRVLFARLDPSLRLSTSGGIELRGSCIPGDTIVVSGEALEGGSLSVSCTNNGSFTLAAVLLGLDGSKSLSLRSSQNETLDAFSVLKDTAPPVVSFGIPSAWFVRPGVGSVTTQTIQFTDAVGGVSTVDEGLIGVDFSAGVTCTKSTTKGSNSTVTVSLSSCSCSGLCSTSGVARLVVAKDAAKDSSGNSSSASTSNSAIRVGVGYLLLGVIEPQTINEDSQLSNLSVPVNSLLSGFSCNTNMSAQSSNSSLISVSGITFSGSYPNCKLSLTPAANKAGTSVITLTANQLSYSSQIYFELTVLPMSDPPTISGISSSQLTNEEVPKSVSFLADDPDGNLTCTAANLMYSSSNPSLVATNGAVAWSGTWPNCTGTISPNLNANGSANIIFMLSDGTSVASQGFTFSVVAVNDAPTIASIPDQTTREDSAFRLPLQVSDVDSALTCADLRYTSSNGLLVTNPGPGSIGTIAFRGNWPDCYADVSSMGDSNGTSLITFTLSDGSLSSSRSFLLTVTPVNDPPLISTISNQSTFEASTISGIPVLLSDPDGPLSCSSNLSAVAAQPTLVSSSGFSFSGVFPDCRLSVTPEPNQFGESYIVVTANDGALSFERSFYLIVKRGWKQEAFIKAPNAHGSSSFGSNVSMSGDLLAVADQEEDWSGSVISTSGSTSPPDDFGAVYIYRRAGTTWSFEAYIKSSNLGNQDYFGSSISLSGDTLVVGAPFEDSRQSSITNGTPVFDNNDFHDSGAVYVYRRSGTNWTHEAYIKAANVDAQDQFGFSVSNSGDTLVVGAKGEDSVQNVIYNGTGVSNDKAANSSGAVYVYRRSGSIWVQEAYLKSTAPDEMDLFGSSVSISGDTLAVGVPSEDSNQTTITNGSSAPINNELANSGAVYVFRRSGVSWSHESYIKARNADSGDRFGGSLSLSGDSLAVGAMYESSNQRAITNGMTASIDNSGGHTGAVYLYRRNGANWQQEAYIKASNGDLLDYFGSSVSLSGDTLAVGAYAEDSNEKTITNGAASSDNNELSNSGAVYVFRRAGANWSQEGYIKASNAGVDDQFGNAVSLSGDTLAVGAPNEDSSQTTITNGSSANIDNSRSNSGAVFVYRHGGRMFDPQVRIFSSNSDSVTLAWYLNMGTSNRVKIAPAAFGLNTPSTCDVAGAIELSAGITSYTYGALLPNTKYGFRVCAFDGTNVSQGAVIWAETTGWAQEAYIKAPNAEQNDWFGWSVSLSGEDLAVSSYAESSSQNTITNSSEISDNNAAANAGAVYLFRRSGSRWAPKAYIKASNARANAAFGSDVSFSGDTLAVSSTLDWSCQNFITNGSTSGADSGCGGSGATFIYRRSGENWSQEAYIKPIFASSGYYFGASISISGDYLAVGATGDDSSSVTIFNGAGSPGSSSSLTDSGAVWVYHRDGNIWTQQAFIKAANSKYGYAFGNDVDISGDTLAVGMRNDASGQVAITNGVSASFDAGSSGAGSVFVYRRRGSTWEQEAYLKAANSQGGGYPLYGDEFGSAIALAGNVIAVGAPEEDSAQNFISNDGSASSDNSAGSAGAVYVFRRNGTQWAQEAYVKASNAGSADRFGNTVAVSGNTLAVGALYEASMQNTITNGSSSSVNDDLFGSGAVYIYKRLMGSWTQIAYIKASNPDRDDMFSQSLSLSGDTLAVGSFREGSSQTTVTNAATAPELDNFASQAGAVYVYRDLGRLYDPRIFVSSKTQSAITVSWNANLGAAKSVKISPATIGVTNPVSCADASSEIVSGNSTSRTFFGLSANTKYGFRVCAFDGTNVSDGTVIWDDTLP